MPENVWNDEIFSNIIEKRYQLSEQDAANDASYLLAGPLLLYPLVRSFIPPLHEQC